MLVSKLIKKLEEEKGFKCNHMCATCLCEKTNENVLNQIEVYAELHNQGVIPDEKYAEEVRILEKESKALVSYCNRLYEVFDDMIETKVDEYIDINNKWLRLDKMPNEVYFCVVNSLKQSFIEKYTGGDRYDRQ
jgi:hypothetical protein